MTRSKLDSKKVCDVLSLVEFTALAFRGALQIWCNWKVSIWEQHFWLPECQWKRDLVMSWCWMAQTHWLGESAVTQRSEEGWLFTPWADFHYDVWKVRGMLEPVLSLLQRGMLERHEQRHECDDFCHLCSFDPDLWWMEPGLDCLDCLDAVIKTCPSIVPGGPDAVVTFWIQWQVCSGPRNGPKKALKFINLKWLKESI